MSRQLVFVHGRAQEGKDSKALKKEWLDALDVGLGKSGLVLPIAEADVKFPYYGDTLYDLVDGKSADEAAAIIVRGKAAGADAEEEQFTRAIMTEIKEKMGITDAQLADVAGQEVVEKGPQNWEWFQAILKAIDQYVPGGSGNSIALFTNDVYQYLKNKNTRDSIDAGVRKAVTKGVETVVVSHSLGTVVSYNVLRQQADDCGWNIVQFITLGSPLAVTEIKNTIRKLKPPVRCPACVGKWFNAMDERDVVALYPLDTRCFPLDPTAPAIENKRDVRNKTENRHGISGYLDDREVARRIHDALVA